jgi:hypothetical protein
MVGLCEAIPSMVTYEPIKQESLKSFGLKLSCFEKEASQPLRSYFTGVITIFL